MRRANYLGLAYQFWTLTKESINEMEKQGNKKLIMSLYDPNETDEQSHNNYYQATRWNDFNMKDSVCATCNFTGQKHIQHHLSYIHAGKG